MRSCFLFETTQTIAEIESQMFLMSAFMLEMLFLFLMPDEEPGLFQPHKLSASHCHLSITQRKHYILEV